jgi:hypothetical protein
MPPSASVLIRRLGRAWAPFAVERQCAKGASRAGLARVKRLAKVPPDLLTVLAWHDGSRGRAIDGYYRLLSCAEVARQKKLMDELIPEFEDAWLPGDWWNADWIPFLEFNGDLICIDQKGTIVSFKAYDAARPLLYSSLRQWLAALVALWEQMPSGVSEDEQADFFDSRAAIRLKRKLEPGYPIARTARKRPAEKRPKGIEYVCEGFTRGPYEWRIERAAATVRTYSGRAYSRRYHVKPFASVDKARAFMESQIRQKLREGYARVKSGSGADDEFLAAAGRHLATLKDNVSC